MNSIFINELKGIENEFIKDDIKDDLKKDLKDDLKKDLKVKLFIVFHNKIFDELYEDLSTKDLNHFTMWGVNKDLEKEYNKEKHYNIMEDYNLPFYDISLEEKNYVQSAAMCHLYYNNIHKDLDYIGIFQYDMKFGKDTVNIIKECVNNNLDKYNKDTIFYIKKSHLNDGFRFNRKPPFFNSDASVLTLYNKYYNTNYTMFDFTEDNFILLHTFILPRHLFEKMMKWFTDNIPNMDAMFNINITGDRGSYTERVHSIFLYLEIMREGYKLQDLPVEEIWPLYKNQTKHIFYKNR